MFRMTKIKVSGWEEAIRGIRNSWNSWSNSDSEFDDQIVIGPNDLKLMLRLAKLGGSDAKYRRMITVSTDILAPLYWWKEFDTYKVGTVVNSCSTMHMIASRPFELNDFSHEHLTGETTNLWVNTDGTDYMCSALDFCQITCDVLNRYRELYLETHNKQYWWQMIQLLPSSYNQLRTVMLNYEVLANIYRSRRNHKLDEWRAFCKCIEWLPFSEIITLNEAAARRTDMTLLKENSNED